jgi:hypothetical protein
MTGSTRASAFLRNLRTVHRRSGVKGTLELVLSRALPRTASYSRATVLVAATAGSRAHEELAPRIVREVDPEVVALWAGLAPEPEMKQYTAADLDERFRRGDELWLFFVDDACAHLRWVTRESFPVAGIDIPLGATERFTGGVVTVPAFRGRGLAYLGAEHVRAVVAAAGVERVFGVINGFNRAFLAGSLDRGGYAAFAIVHAIALAGTRWTRIVPVAAEAERLLTERGLPVRRWFRS